jgi:hypothetical protein
MKNSRKAECLIFTTLLCASIMLAPSARAADEPPVYNADLVQQFDASNARQGVAVDGGHFYAVNNYAITRHDKSTGEIVG